MSTTSSHSNDSSIKPSSNREWFELILPLIDVPASEATEDDLRSIAKTHAHQVIDRVDEFDFLVDSIDWIASSRLKTLHGRCSPSGKTPGKGWTITLALRSLRRNGWVDMMSTVRHELVHVWQMKNDFFQPQRGVDVYHDHESFERWLAPLGIQKRGGKICERRYEVHCQSCGWGFTSHRMTLQINHVVYDMWDCPVCSGDAASIEARDRKENRILTPEDQNYSVMTWAMRSVAYQIDNGDEKWRWRELIEFPGIGKRTVEQLGRELMKVDDMVDGQQLAEPLREIVSSQFHDELWAEARSYVDWKQAENTLLHHSCRPNPEDYFDTNGNRLDLSRIPPESPNQPPETTDNNSSFRRVGI